MKLPATRPAASDARLRQLVLDLAASPQGWLHLVRYDPGQRWYQRVIVMCSQGYASSLAAASLQDIGLVNATDLAGGFLAWAQAGLPCQPGTAPPAG